jgi:hypothetical protein
LETAIASLVIKKFDDRLHAMSVVKVDEGRARVGWLCLQVSLLFSLDLFAGGLTISAFIAR